MPDRWPASRGSCPHPNFASLAESSGPARTLLSIAHENPKVLLESAALIQAAMRLMRGSVWRRGHPGLSRWSRSRHTPIDFLPLPADNPATPHPFRR